MYCAVVLPVKCCSVTYWLLCVFQGDSIDNIEKNVSKSEDHITEAREQTKKAIKHQGKARKVMSFNPPLHQSAAGDLFPVSSA